MRTQLCCLSLFVGLSLLAAGCGKTAGGGGDETHFLCDSDRDCERLGPDYQCIDGRCELAIASDAATTDAEGTHTPTGDAAGTDAPGGGSSRDGGAGNAGGGGDGGGGGANGGGATNSGGGSTAAGGENGGGGATNGGTGGTNVGGGAGSGLIDPHAERRQELAEDYCEVCPDDVNVAPSQNCAAALNVRWFDGIPLQCWDELVASAECSKENDCYEISGGLVNTGPCLEQRTALDDCIVSSDTNRGSIEGSVATCGWRQPISTGCEVGCGGDLERAYAAVCSGPPGGPFSCGCTLNGRFMFDSMIPNGHRFHTDTCEEAGQFLADGFCHQITSCCYTYPNSEQRTVCECTSDPTFNGQFDSCEERAVLRGDGTSRDGVVIDLCPGYLPSDVVP